jgi:hypothetical protein
MYLVGLPLNVPCPSRVILVGEDFTRDAERAASHQQDQRHLQRYRLEEGRVSNDKIGSAVSASPAPQPTVTNPLDFVPDKIPFDTPYVSLAKMTITL